MSAHLTAGQRAALRAQLETRQQQLQRRLSDHLSGQTRAEDRVEAREQDADDVPQREGERGLDMALSELETVELATVSEALRRLATERYGLCVDCDEEIPFDRLRVEPWALRCVACQAQRESAG
jgi:RNA polymerase-binding transcription factor